MGGGCVELRPAARPRWVRRGSHRPRLLPRDSSVQPKVTPAFGPAPLPVLPMDGTKASLRGTRFPSERSVGSQPNGFPFLSCSREPLVGFVVLPVKCRVLKAGC